MSKPCPTLSRRAMTLGLLAAPSLAWAAPAAPIVTVLGDSITAGYGLTADLALPAQLQLALRRLGGHATVRGAGVSGDTTAAGLARVGFSVQDDTRLCLVALGGNDLLRGVEPKVTQANLTAIVTRLKARGIKVMLAGLTAPQSLGGAWAREFDAVFPAVAKAQGVTLYANLLAGVMQDSRYNQADGVHPNAAGVVIIAGRLARTVMRAL